MLTKEIKVYQIVNFMTCGARVSVIGRGHISYKVKMHYFCGNLLLYSQEEIRQTTIDSKKGFTKIVIYEIITTRHYVCSRQALPDFPDYS